MVLHSQNLIRVASEQRLVVLVALVKQPDASIERTYANAETILRNVDGADGRLVHRLQVKLAEVEGPDTERLVFGADHTEGLVHRYGENG